MTFSQIIPPSPSPTESKRLFYSPFPPEGEAMGIPVLWVINNGRITPPWGKIARIQNDR